jgi:hypothetical protein
VLEGLEALIRAAANASETATATGTAVAVNHFCERRGAEKALAGGRPAGARAGALTLLANCEVLCAACQRPPQPVRVR